MRSRLAPGIAPTFVSLFGRRECPPLTTSHDDHGYRWGVSILESLSGKETSHLPLLSSSNQLYQRRSSRKGNARERFFQLCLPTAAPVSQTVR